ncbi:MAG: HAD family hydrolase [Dermatophilaceae bacterium]
MSAPSPTPSAPAYRRRLVALDVDGTLVDHSGGLSSAVADAVGAVVDAGHHVIIATGRSVLATTIILEQLGLTHGYAVCSNGAVTLELDPGQAGGFRIIDTVTFDPRPVLTVLRQELPGALVAVEELGVGFKVSAPFPEGELYGQQTVVDWDHLVDHPATRVTLRMPDAELEDFMARVEAIGLHEVAYAVGWTAWLDLNPEGVSKGSALELLRRRLHVEPADTVAVGDQRNDIEMLQWAARGVAMGNSPSEVQAVANEVTDTVEQDGLTPVLRSLV